MTTKLLWYVKSERRSRLLGTIYAEDSITALAFARFRHGHFVFVDSRR